jgi:hypothetical protein
LLFVLDRNGVPSEGQFVKLPVASKFPVEVVTALSTAPKEASLYVLGFANADDGFGVQGSQVWSKFIPMLRGHTIRLLGRPLDPTYS